jgi:TPR repeat protein
MVNSPIPKIAAGIADMGGAGLPEAQYIYGRMLVEGRGVVCDLKAARAWFTRAADSGMADAQVALAEMMLNGRGGPVSTAAALELVRGTCRQPRASNIDCSEEVTRPY